MDSFDAEEKDAINEALSFMEKRYRHRLGFFRRQVWARKPMLEGDLAIEGIWQTRLDTLRNLKKRLLS